MDLPTTRIDLENLIKNQVQESLHLDYKDSRAISDKLRHEIAKDVSAFANADGGVII
jgi:predicted HTH transcriptional regulator